MNLDHLARLESKEVICKCMGLTKASSLKRLSLARSEAILSIKVNKDSDPVNKIET